MYTHTFTSPHVCYTYNMIMSIAIHSECTLCRNARGELHEWPHDGQMGPPTCIAVVHRTTYTWLGHDRCRPEPHHYPDGQDHGRISGGTVCCARTGMQPASMLNSFQPCIFTEPDKAQQQNDLWLRISVFSPSKRVQFVARHTRDPHFTCCYLRSQVSRVSVEVSRPVTMKNAIFWDMKTQFAPHRKHIVSATEPSRLILC
jgi:hypothetical protein